MLRMSGGADPPQILETKLEYESLGERSVWSAVVIMRFRLLSKISLTVRGRSLECLDAQWQAVEGCIVDGFIRAAHAVEECRRQGLTVRGSDTPWGKAGEDSYADQKFERALGMGLLLERAECEFGEIASQFFGLRLGVKQRRMSLAVPQVGWEELSGLEAKNVQVGMTFQKYEYTWPENFWFYLRELIDGPLSFVIGDNRSSTVLDENQGDEFGRVFLGLLSAIPGLIKVEVDEDVREYVWRAETRAWREEPEDNPPAQFSINWVEEGIIDMDKPGAPLKVGEMVQTLKVTNGRERYHATIEWVLRKTLHGRPTPRGCREVLSQLARIMRVEPSYPLIYTGRPGSWVSAFILEV
jgi:hypothetical protein